MNKAKSQAQPDIDRLTPQEIAEIAARLERDDYDNPFDSLRDWHTLRALAFRRPDLVEPYIHLLDMEAYDEC
ncbi:MAG: DUF2555 domain-containing protein [Pseudanabaenaceae cyanobacterium]